MKRTELIKLSNKIRRETCKTHGFRQSDYINWMVKSGYFFYLQVLRLEDVTLMVKPLYVDDLWFDIFELPKNKRPLSLRGTGAFKVFGKEIATYDFLPGDISQYTENDVEIIWQEIFVEMMHDVEMFLQNNPDADKYIPEIDDKYNDQDCLMYLMALIHNSRKDEAVKMIEERKLDGHHCLYHSYHTDMDSYDYILKWCKK